MTFALPSLHASQKMMKKVNEFESVITNVGGCETRIQQYLIQPKNASLSEDNDSLLAFNEPDVELKRPQIYIWEFLDKESLLNLLTVKRKRDILKFIGNTLKNVQNEVAKTVYIQLMFDVVKFSRASEFPLEKTGAVLSQFYLTHLFFTSNFNVAADKVHAYFKDLMLHHCLSFLPYNAKIFTPGETKQIMMLFCKLYLRNLPLIRFLCLPNFAFHLDYDLEPEPVMKVVDKKKKVGAKKAALKRRNDLINKSINFELYNVSALFVVF